MTPFNLPAVGMAVLFAGCIIWLIRRERLGPLQTLWWLASALGLLVLGLVPAASALVGSVFGLGEGTAPVLALGLCLVFIKLLFVDAERVRQEARIRILAQKMAAHEARLYELEEQDSSRPHGDDR